MTNFKKLPLILVLAIMKHCHLHDLFQVARSCKQTEEFVKEMVRDGYFACRHVIRCEKREVQLQLNMEFKRERKGVANQREIEQAEMPDDVIAQETMSFIFCDHKFKRAKRMQGKRNTEKTAVKNCVNDVNTLYFPLNWWQISEATSFLLDVFNGPLEVSIFSNHVREMAKILRKIPKETQCFVFEMGYAEMTGEDADEILGSVPMVETFVFSHYGGTLQEFTATNFSSIIFDCCPNIDTKNIQQINPSRNIEIINSTNIDSIDVFQFILWWLQSTNCTLERLRLEFQNVRNSIDIEKIKETFRSVGIIHYPYNQQRREQQRETLNYEKAQNYMHLFEVTDSVDFIRVHDGAVGTLLKTENAVSFVVWFPTDSVMRENYRNYCRIQEQMAIQYSFSNAFSPFSNFPNPILALPNVQMF